MNGGYRRKSVFLLGFILVVSSLYGCQFRKYYNNTSCCIHSVCGSNTGTVYMCENKTDRFLYQREDSTREIFNEAGDKPIVTLEEHDELNCMAASNDVLIYATETNEGTLFGYSLKQNTMLYEISDYAVFGMKACGNDVFVTVKIKDYKYDAEASYDILLFRGEDNYVSLSDLVSKLNPVKEQDPFLFYSYDGYEIVADRSLCKDKPQVVYIEKNTFRYSCLPYNTYICYDNVMYCIDTQADFLPEMKGGYGGIAPSMVYEKNGACLFVAQYSERYYQCNPNASFIKANYFCKYNLVTKEFVVLYRAERDEQIAGFSPNGDVIYLLKNEGLYEKNIISGENILLLKNEFEDEEAYGMGTYHFENQDDRLAVFSTSGRTRSTILIMELVY